MTDNTEKVRQALIRICTDEACATVDDIRKDTRLTHKEVTSALRALVAKRRACAVKEVAQWANPIDEQGRPLVCGTWCG